MRYIFGLLLALLATRAMAYHVEFPAEGNYKAKSYDVLLSVHHLVIPNMSPDYENRIQALKDDGYGCVRNALQMTKCSKSESVANLPLEIVQRIKDKWFNLILDIDTVRSEPTLTVDGESYQEWNVPQAVSFRGKTYTEYRLMVSEDIKKMALGKTFAGAEHYFNFTSNNRKFQAIVQETKTISRFEFIGFLIAVNFE